MPLEITWEVNPQNPHLIRVSICCEFWADVVARVFLKHAKELSACSGIEELEQHYLLLERKTAKNHALRLLSIKSRLTEELRKKLSIKGFCEKSIAWAIEECNRLGFIDDSEETRRFAFKQLSKGIGPRRIVYEVKARGGVMTSSLWQELLEQQGAILERLKQKYASKGTLKLRLFLQRRGF